MPAPQLLHAKLIPARRAGARVIPERDPGKHLEVQFNPASLRLTLANDVRADSRAGSGRAQAAAQYLGSGESTLAVELVFDTSVPWRTPAEEGASEERERAAANSDVRQQTRRIAEAFMKPQGPAGRPQAPQLCRFQWGAFQFTGVLASYGETLDFFAPEGIPLRATLALTFKEDRFQFETLPAPEVQREAPSFAPGGEGVTADRAAQSAGLDPREWRAVADASGLENPRFTPLAGVLVPRPD
jgi:hypothetical protein